MKCGVCSSLSDLEWGRRSDRKQHAKLRGPFLVGPKKNVVMGYLISCCRVIYNINPNLPVSSLSWMSAKDRHLHSFLVIFSWSSKSCDLNVLLQGRKSHFDVVVFLFDFGIRVNLLYVSPATFRLAKSSAVTPSDWSAFNNDVPVVTLCHQTAVFDQNSWRWRGT